jgi:hypothetical protein
VQGNRLFGWALGLGVAALATAAQAQDLFDRQGQGRQSSGFTGEAYMGRDRLDLRVGGTIPASAGARSASIGLGATLEGDFACGKFDLRANLKNLMTKEAGKEMVGTLLGALESELMYNALVLACEASPTACQAFQHFRMNANALLKVGYDRCAAVEAGIQDGLQGAKAQAIKDCVDEKRRGGQTMDQALAACDQASAMRGLTGAKVTEFDLGRELQKAFNLNDLDARDLNSLLSKMRLTPSGVGGQVAADAVRQEFLRVQKEYTDAWAKAMQAKASDPKAPVDPEIAGKLQPQGSPAPLPDELAQIAQLPRQVQRVFIGRVASQAALLDLTQRVQDLERRLAAAAKLPQNDQGKVRLMEQELRDLRLQLNQIDELVTRQDRWNAALLGSSEAAELYRAKEAAQAYAAGQSRQEDSRIRGEFAPEWGGLKKPSDPTRGTTQGLGCPGRLGCDGSGQAGIGR